MNKKFPEYENLNLPSIAKEILSRWEEEDVFNKSVAIREGKAPFVFYEGPPSANGMPGIHHVMSRTIKDLFCRYKTLKGFQVKRKAGWDTHGLPVELAVEKELGITKEDIGKKISIEDYNRECRKAVMKYKNVWDDLTKKMGYWVDLENPYITYENSYIESVWYLLKMLYDQKLLYKGYTIQPYSPAAGTGLSSHELNLPGCYKNVKDNTAVAMFKVCSQDKAKIMSFVNKHPVLNGQWRIFDTYLKIEESNLYFLAWTTTPWTLSSNTALAVGANIEYAIVQTLNRFTKQPVIVVLAKDLLSKYFEVTSPNSMGSFVLGGTFYSLEEAEKNNLQNSTLLNENVQDLLGKVNLRIWRVLSFVKGHELNGIKYEQLLPYAQPLDGAEPFRVIIGDFVSTEDGTGIVHIAPTFGADDMRVAKQYGISGILVKDENGDLTPIVDKRGRFVKEMQDEVWGFAGEFVKEEYLSKEEKEKEFRKQKKTLESAGKIKELKEYLSVDKRLILKLQEEGKLFKKEIYEHNYPHCWRTDKPILYYPLDSWFIRATAAKERMIELNKTINWKPEHTGTGRFGEWLNNLQDWNLSRSRYWGIPLPVWWNWMLDKKICVGSIDEFKQEGWYYLTDKYFELENWILQEDLRAVMQFEIFNNSFFEKVKKQFPKFKNPIHIDSIFQLARQNRQNIIHNLHHDFLIENGYVVSTQNIDFSSFDFHRPYIDRLVFIEIANLQMSYKYIREKDLIDVWFDSGAMPFAQWGAKSADDKMFRENFPADFIAEGVDQTRGWFYTLHAIAVMCFGSVAYKNVISNGLVLDKNGQKMSKRLGNVVDPFETIGKFGADATRWYLITNSQPWENLKFDMEGIAEVQKKFFRALYNTYAFFALYANIDSFRHAEKEIPISERPEMDRWILSELNDLIKSVDSCYEKYEPTAAGRLIEKFVVDKLSNWYVRLNRRRFWKGEQGTDKTAAYQTLYKCLEAVAQLASPIAPFYCEKLYTDLKSAIANQQSTINSVHLSDFPECDETLININLQEKMEIAQALSSLVLSLRKKEKIRVRQPLQKMLIPGINADFVKKLEAVKDLILSEVNVKQLEIISVNTEVLIKTIKPNFKILGPKYGKLMKEISEAVSKFTQEDISALESAGIYRLPVNGEKIDLQITDFEILSQSRGLGPGWRVASEGRFTVALDVTISEQLKEEGIAREIVNKIQNIRKDKGFEVTDKILLKIQSNKLIDSAIYNNLNYICSETLASSLNLVEKIPHKDAAMVEVEEGVETLISIEKLN